MNKTQIKWQMIAKQPRCPICTAKMVVTTGTEKFGQRSNAAIIDGDRLVCFQCHRIAVKKRDIEKLPLLTRWKKKLDRFTGIPTCLHVIRVRWNQFVYFKLRGGSATGRKPEWL